MMWMTHEGSRTSPASGQGLATERSRWRAAAMAAGMLVAALLALTLAGCEASYPRDTLAPVSDEGDVSAWFFWLYMILDTVIFAVVCALFVYALVRFRKKDGDDGSLPPQVYGNHKLELIWTVIPTIIVLVLAVVTVGGIFRLSTPPKIEQKVVEIDVTGKQWWWEFDYKHEAITAANEMHVEIGTPVILNLTSTDVIHAFWVPRMGGKRDATPGRTYPLYFTPRELGTFDGQCAELCGASHALMGLRIVVHAKEGEDSYDAWVAGQRAPAREAETDVEKAGKQIFLTRGCVACHSVKGVAELAPQARGAISGPNLTHVGSRSTILALTRENTVDNIAAWVQNPAAVKQGSRMPNFGVNADDARAVATWLHSLK